MRRLTLWCGAGLLLFAAPAGSACQAQATIAGIHAVAPAEMSRIPLTFAPDSSATVSHRGTHAVIGAVIGAAIGLVVGTVIDHEANKKTLNDRNAEPVTVHLGGFLLPPLGAIIGAVIGWHK